MIARPRRSRKINLITRRGGHLPRCSIAPSPHQFNFDGSSPLRSVRDGASMHARRPAKPASVCARSSSNICRLQVSTLARTSSTRTSSPPDNLNHLASQGVEFAAQLHHISLTLFTATIEVAHGPPSYATSCRNCSNSPRKFSSGPPARRDAAMAAFAKSWRREVP